MTEIERIIYLYSVYEKHGDIGFFVVPHEIAEVVNLIDDGIIHFNNGDNLIREINRINKEKAKIIYEILKEHL
jgi:hypothetical protein